MTKTIVDEIVDLGKRAITNRFREYFQKLTHFIARQTYDGIWAAALAIQYVAKRKEHFVSKFEYRVKDWENIFLDALRNTSFEGVTVCHQNI